MEWDCGTIQEIPERGLGVFVPRSQPHPFTTLTNLTNLISLVTLTTHTTLTTHNKITTVTIFNTLTTLYSGRNSPANHPTTNMSARTLCTTHFLATGEGCPVCDLTPVEIIVFFGRWMWSNRPPVTGSESPHNIKLWADDDRLKHKTPWWKGWGKKAKKGEVRVPEGVDPAWHWG
ncbi:uncharacterized protein LAJ45_03643 [Morchella importuna]|uniref:uncharacterized protein n=1 Tax=Morchella importuna TaxID=1174673 RepID=UPI001E8E87D6|nr:uncharacterized protein LAJ45_03643 [Morchella importuna]KAH8152217.1 hypothetical protein LAJ45_03643 [Morchella importuna]